MNCHRQHRRVSPFGLRICFGFRASNFGFRPLPPPRVFTRAMQRWPLRACPACAGQSDSPMAKGMNYGIFSLLAVIGVVLGGVASFFVYLGKKSATMAALSAAVPTMDLINRDKT